MLIFTILDLENLSQVGEEFVIDPSRQFFFFFFLQKCSRLVWANEFFFFFSRNVPGRPISHYCFPQILTIFQFFLLLLNGEEFWKVRLINRKWCVMQNYVIIIFLSTFPYYLLYFAKIFQKTNNFAWSCWVFEHFLRNTTAGTKTFT